MQISSRESAVSLRVQKLGFGLSALHLQMTIKEGKTRDFVSNYLLSQIK